MMGWVIGLLAVLVVIVAAASIYFATLLETISARLFDIQVGIKRLREEK